MGRIWGRLYAGTRNHRKIKILRQRHPTMWFAWYVLIELAIECDDDGWIYVAPDRPYTWKELAQEIGTGRSDNAERFVRTLIDLGLASHTEGKGIRLTSYSERNYESDSSTARVQKYRERKKSEGVDETFQERSGNVSVTDQNRNRTETEQKQNKTETEAETETEEKILSADGAADRPSDGFGIQNLAKLWNEKAPPELPRVKIPLVRKPQKLKALQDSLKRNPEKTFWEKLLENIYFSSFMRGKNDRGWKATFDFVIDHANEITDGKYIDNGFNQMTREEKNFVAAQQFIADMEGSPL